MTRFNNFVIATALGCAASLAYAHKVRVDFDHAASFGAYKTYSWEPSATSGGADPVFPNQLMRQRIVGFIEEALGARKLTRVNSGGDLLVSYRVTVQEIPQYVTFGDPWPGWGWGDGWGWGGGWGSGISTTTVQTFYDGTLIVNVVDAKRNLLVFQGTSTQEISSRPEKNTKKLYKAVSEIFERYPPRP